ncbi:uncharacterized protein LOC143600408 [Bidens hawaiensis]|uniref:uncharacterized protein LOC143600408 n=1 Tax=Bidens hawaiensis TaxID=980011 RepID=UPI00404A770D
MGETTNSASVNQKFLTSIMNVRNISNMDWCSYLITCLKRTKERWNGKDPYNGPLTFLAVLYAHEQQLKDNPVYAVTPAIQYVTTDYLDDLESSMYEYGPCSNDDIEEDNRLTQNVKAQVQLIGSEAQSTGNKVLVHNESTKGGRTAIDHPVNVPQVEVDADQFQSTNPHVTSVQTDLVSSADLGHCNRLEPPKNEKLCGDPKQKDCDMVENVSSKSNSAEGLTGEVQPQTDDGQTAVEQNVNVPLDEEDGLQPQTNEGQTAIDHNVKILQDKEVEDLSQSTNHDSVSNLSYPLAHQMLNQRLDYRLL